MNLKVINKYDGTSKRKNKSIKGESNTLPLKFGENSLFGRDLLKMKLPLTKEKSEAIILKIELNEDKSGSIQILDNEFTIEVKKPVTANKFESERLKCFICLVVENFLNIYSLNLTKENYTFGLAFEEMSKKGIISFINL